MMKTWRYIQLSEIVVSEEMKLKYTIVRINNHVNYSVKIVMIYGIRATAYGALLEIQGAVWNNCKPSIHHIPSAHRKIFTPFFSKSYKTQKSNDFRSWEHHGSTWRISLLSCPEPFRGMHKSQFRFH